MWRLCGFLALLTVFVVNAHEEGHHLKDLPFKTDWLKDAARDDYEKTAETEKANFLIKQFDAADAEQKTAIRAQVIPACYSGWLSAAERTELEGMHKSHDHANCRKRVEELLSALPDDEEHNVRVYWPFCAHVWYEHDDEDHKDHHHHEGHDHHHRRRRHLNRHARHMKDSFDDFANDHLRWLSADKSAELKSLYEKEGGAKVAEAIMHEYKQLTGAQKTEARTQILDACRELIVQTFGKEKAAELKEIRDSGRPTADAELKAKIDELFGGVEDDAQKSKALRYRPFCEIVYAGSESGGKHRRRRNHHQGHHLEDYLKTHLSWLSDAEKQELLALKTNEGYTEEQLRAKVMEWYDAAVGEKKTQAKTALQGACKELLKGVMGAEKTDDLRRLKDEGKSNAEIYARVKKLIADVADEPQKARLQKYSQVCKKVFDVDVGAARRRRAAHHDLEMKLKGSWSWLSDAQKDEIRGMQRDGKSSTAILARVFEFYDKLTENRAVAQDGLQDTCQADILTMLGTDKAAELKRFMENGAEEEVYEGKVRDLLKTLDVKKSLSKNQQNCKRVFVSAAARKLRRVRRDHHHDHAHDHDHSLEGYLATHLSWLSDEQKAELRQMKTDGKPKEELREKVWSIYEATDGPTKEKATTELRAACRELLTSVVGAEKAAELKRLAETGQTVDQIASQIETWIAALGEDNEQVKAAKPYRTHCRRLFGVSSRRRRHQHDHSHHMQQTMNDYSRTQQAMLSEARPERKAHPVKKRRHAEHDHAHHHTLEDYFKTHLSWLSDPQKSELRQMKTDGKSREDLHQKIWAFYEATEGTTRTQATNKLKSGCRELLLMAVGEDKAANLKKLHEAGRTPDEIATRLDEILKEVGDETKRQTIQPYRAHCRQLFVGASASSARRRRALRAYNPSANLEQQTKLHDHHHHMLEEYLKTHLLWLTDAQREQLRQLKISGQSFRSIQERIFHFYERSRGAKRAEAFAALQTACREFLNHYIGEAAVEELARMRADVAPKHLVLDKALQFVEAITDETKRAHGEYFVRRCETVLGADEQQHGLRRRRDHHHHAEDLESSFNSYLSWLTDTQKDEIRELKKAGKSEDELQKRVFEFYAQTDGATKTKATEQMKVSCKKLLTTIIGDEKTAELAKLRENGAEMAELDAKATEWIDAIGDGHLKGLAQRFSKSCRQVYGI